MMLAVWNNFCKDIKAHFRRKGARPMVMTMMCLAIACAAVLTYFVVGAEQGGIFAALFSGGGDSLVWLAATAMLCMFAVVLPLTLNPDLRKDLENLQNFELSGSGNRRGVVVTARYVSNILLAAFAAVAGYGLVLLFAFCFSIPVSAATALGVGAKLLLCVGGYGALFTLLSGFRIAKAPLRLLPILFSAALVGFGFLARVDYFKLLSGALSPLLWLFLTVPIVFCIVTYLNARLRHLSKTV